MTAMLVLLMHTNLSYPENPSSCRLLSSQPNCAGIYLVFGLGFAMCTSLFADNT